ncbi:MAG TPA: M20/M25/M40 family metallo-hydrolase [Holophagaceae bacterium]|jgi:carboxypeptidase Q|nr:M20/M25/M40 family metallo-hydrolase [Holophagaceae bacterium]
MRRFLPLLLASVLVAQDPSAAMLKPQAPEAFAALKELTTRIGPRLTGSPQERAAHAWALARFKALGLETGQLGFPLAHTWSRGAAQALLQGRALRLAQWGWTPATAGAITAPLVLLRTPDDVARMKDRLKGAIVLAGPPSRRLDPPQMNPPLKEHRAPVPEEGFPADELTPALKAAGVLAILTDAGKSRGLLNMNSPWKLEPGGLPVAFVAHPDYAKLCAANRQLRLELGGDFGPGGEGLVTWAELKGAEHPDECVILGAHLDSWDLATGATDNGAGAAAILEAARLLVKSGAKPGRGIRFVLFSGEEQGYLGSLAYAKATLLERVSAVFVVDTGAGAINGFALQHRPEAAKMLMPLLAPLAKLGVTETDLRDEGGTDHVPFDGAGVPAFCAEQIQHDYAAIHHSEADTLAHVRPAELEQAAQVMAYTALRVADLPGLLPREREAKPEESH